MKNKIKKILNLILPLAIAIAIIYYQYTTLSKEELSNIKKSLLHANYFYVFLSLLIALYGFWARAYRWKYALNYLGYTTKFHNNFLSVAVSYLVNLTVPRSGEISRAVLLKKYENVPVDKGLGTIVSERIVDLLLFGFFVIIAFILQYNVIYNFIATRISFEKIILFTIIAFVLFVFLLLFWIYSKWSFIIKIKEKLAGLLEGMTSILKMKHKWQYIIQSILIWVSYMLMFYVTIFALKETASISFNVVLMGFIFGSLAIGFTNGGLGAYPLAIAMIFSLYKIPNETGVAFGWLVWTSQTLLTIVIGIISYLLLPIFNKDKSQENNN